MLEIKLPDISLKDVHLTERVSELRKDYFRAMPEMCVERPRLITRFTLDKGFFGLSRGSAEIKINDEKPGVRLAIAADFLIGAIAMCLSSPLTRLLKNLR
jgi:hypothetical protein